MSIKKISLRFVLIFSALSIGSCAIVEHQIAQHSGASTDLVDTKNIADSAKALAITNVNVLSPDSSRMLTNQTVLIRDGKIIEVANHLAVSKEFKVIDGKDKYLIPGLIDTHVHLWRSKNDLLLYLANGVTHIANMSSLTDNTYLKWRTQAQNGALSPQIYVAAGGMSSKKGFMVSLKTLFGESKGYNTASEARAAVRKFKNEGYDGIKAYNVNPEAFFALNDEAIKTGIPVVGHLAGELTLEDLYNSGQSQLAHVEEIVKASMREFGGLTYTNGDQYLEYITEKAEQIAVRVKQNNIVVSSTIWLMESLPKQRYDTHNFLKTIELEYQNPGIIEGSWLAPGWLPGDNNYQAQVEGFSPARIEKSKRATDIYVAAIHIMLKALAQNDVLITAGTDANAPGTVPGFSFHDELESLNNAGLTNTQVLQSATLAPAQWLNANSGMIAKGYRADLVLLTENPLEDIRHTRSIQAVISSGKYLTRESLDTLLNKVKTANKESRKFDIGLFSEPLNQ
jgi:hypothetical protein